MVKQRGVALVMVLLVVALVASLAVTMSGRLQNQVQRTINLQQAEQSYWYWQSAEALVRQVLLYELDDSDGVVNLAQNWASQTGPYPVAGGEIAGDIKDLQSCFNVNALNISDADVLQQRKTQFKQLLIALEFNDYNADVMVDSLVDWLDADDVLSGTYGAETPDYLGMPHPYRAANGNLQHISELRLVRGYTATAYNRLRPYVCAIPGRNELALNVNTIDAEQPQLLVAISSGNMPLSAAQAFLQQRPDAGYDSIERVMQLPAFVQAANASKNNKTGSNNNQRRNSGGNGSNNNNGGADGGADAGQGATNGLPITVSSEYFELTASVRIADLQTRATSIIQVRDGKAYTLYRAFGD
ncbi:type II secretion system minor pseudopilin GspK [Idiomarina xiamenensis]|uniref:Type II secretion system protein K n=1 Tax=Idiomarina xiamenensis 10-D-4 TaxID=740709 RepID=K2KBP9_9GAMM|nr:type II secretion system minor pseudopilin GspK [Idiomarina xiamenensis]EKE85213.1 Type II secretory pathway, component PulK [Idiomarina xiamenensis 10-D-4]